MPLLQYDPEIDSDAIRELKNFTRELPDGYLKTLLDAVLGERSDQLQAFITLIQAAENVLATERYEPDFHDQISFLRAAYQDATNKFHNLWKKPVEKLLANK